MFVMMVSIGNITLRMQLISIAYAVLSADCGSKRCAIRTKNLNSADMSLVKYESSSTSLASAMVIDPMNGQHVE